MVTDQTALGGQGNTETPGDNPGENSGDNSGDIPGNNPGDQSGGNTENPPGDNPGDKPGDNSGDKPGEISQAPDSYEAFTTGEGYEVSDDALKDFQALAKESNLTQAQAQKFVDVQVAQQQQQFEQLTKQGGEWLTQAKEHYGDKYDASVGSAAKGLDYMFGEDASEIKQILDNTQLGNNLAFIKAFEKVGLQISEGKFVSGTNGQVNTKTAASILYPSKE